MSVPRMNHSIVFLTKLAAMATLCIQAWGFAQSQTPAVPGAKIAELLSEEMDRVLSAAPNSLLSELLTQQDHYKAIRFAFEMALQNQAESMSKRIKALNQNFTEVALCPVPVAYGREDISEDQTQMKRMFGAQPFFAEPVRQENRKTLWEGYQSGDRMSRLPISSFSVFLCVKAKGSIPGVLPAVLKIIFHHRKPLTFKSHEYDARGTTDYHILATDRWAEVIAQKQEQQKRASDARIAELERQAAVRERAEEQKRKYAAPFSLANAAYRIPPSETRDSVYGNSSEKTKEERRILFVLDVSGSMLDPNANAPTLGVFSSGASRAMRGLIEELKYLKSAEGDYAVNVAFVYNGSGDMLLYPTPIPVDDDLVQRIQTMSDYLHNNQTLQKATYFAWGQTLTKSVIDPAIVLDEVRTVGSATLADILEGGAGGLQNTPDDYVVFFTDGEHVYQNPNSSDDTILLSSGQKLKHFIFYPTKENNYFQELAKLPNVQVLRDGLAKED